MMTEHSDRLSSIVGQIADAPAEATFVDLVRISGLDIGRHFRFTDLSGVSFCGCNLAGFDFTGARLHNCDFSGAQISGARFDGAEINGTNLRGAADWRSYRNGWRRATREIADRHLPISAVFQDAPIGPELVVVPAGKFLMGSVVNEGDADEHPLHEVVIHNRLAVARFPTTFEEWDFAVANNGVSYIPHDEGWGRNRRPVINISWQDAAAYAGWLSKCTGKRYRLLSEAEWEYCCRAGAPAEYGDGANIDRDHARFSISDQGSAKWTVAVGSFPPNKLGLYDMHGNVWEWCEDAYHEDYVGAPADGSSWSPETTSSTMRRVLRGGSWVNLEQSLRCATRNAELDSARQNGVGFRLARNLD